MVASRKDEALRLALYLVALPNLKQSNSRLPVLNVSVARPQPVATEPLRDPNHRYRPLAYTRVTYAALDGPVLLVNADCNIRLKTLPPALNNVDPIPKDLGSVSGFDPAVVDPGVGGGGYLDAGVVCDYTAAVTAWERYA